MFGNLDVLHNEGLDQDLKKQELQPRRESREFPRLGSRTTAVPIEYLFQVGIG